MILVPERSIALIAAMILVTGTTTIYGQSTEAIDFGRQIQPILAKRCFACHGPDKSEGGLRLDQKELSFRKMESGKQPLVPKDPGHSELFRRVTSSDDTERMPPEGMPLTPAQVELLKRWIEQGAEWKEHWAFEPLQSHQPPVVKDLKWITNPIDSFVLSKLEHSSLVPAPLAGKATLLRRVTFDLTGLPPTPAEVDSFLADNSPDAYEKVVDRLLQSERFGEQWARHWLDVVRYADTNSFERDGPKPNAWRFRDYVIRSFNQDKPYDQFIREQIAGDELPDAGSDGLIATGFYRLGQWDDEPADRLLAIYDGLDDIITTTGQGFLGLTVNCARCHDHKIDPISQRDYYSLLAFFQGVTPNGNPNPNVERPIFDDPAGKQAYDAAVKEHQNKLNALQASVSAIEKEFRERLDKRDPSLDQPDMDELEYRFYRDTWKKLPDFDSLKPETVAKLEKGFFDISPATREFSFGFVFVGTLKVPADGEYTFIVDSDDGSRLTVNGQEVVLYDGIHGTGQPHLGKIALKQGRLPIRVDYFQGSAGARRLVVKWSGPGFEQRYLSATTEEGVRLGDRRGKRKDFVVLMAAQGPATLGKDRYEEYTKLVQQLDELKRHKVEAAYALCVSEVGTNPPETMLLKRGNPQSPGDKVVPAFLSVLGGGTANIPTPPATAKTSGRRSVLANWIASKDNRLTARVMMNRIWQHYFGRGIVRSPNNFGLLGDRPTHPELLDWLAIELMNESTSDAAPTVSVDSKGSTGTAPWTMKRMHKLIVTSTTYRMGSRANATAEGNGPGQSESDLPNPYMIDPLNHLFYKHDMRRLSAEEIRDSILAVDGLLNTKMYGPGVFPEISDEVKAGQSVPGSGWGNSTMEDQSRRSIYVQVKRSMILPILSDFDFADTDSSCAARFTTTQPTQALGMLNGKFLNDQSAQFAKRLRNEAPDDVKKQVSLAFRLALAREPEATMIERGLKLIEFLKAKHGLSAEKALDQFCLMTLNLNEFVYLD